MGEPVKAILKNNKNPLAKSVTPGKAKDSDWSVGSQGKRAIQKTYRFRVDMWCEGCALDVKQALEAAKSASTILDYTIDYSTKKVTISSCQKMDEVYMTLAKAGKTFVLEDSKAVEVGKKTK